MTNTAIIDRTELQDYLINFRKRIEKIWSSDTAFNPTGEQVKDNNLLGQCMVSALLLKDYLSNLLKTHNIDVVRGKVLDSNNEVIIADHAWITIEFENAETVIDITADQSKILGHKVIFENKKNLDSLGINYQAKQKIDSKSELVEHPGLKHRYELLKERLV